jgi:hypothetical protein
LQYLQRGEGLWEGKKSCDTVCDHPYWNMLCSTLGILTVTLSNILESFE